MSISEVLDSIKDESFNEIKCEFKSLFLEAKNDNNEFIKNVASLIEMTLSYRVQGLLSKEDVTTFFKKQKKIAMIHVNSVEIAVKARFDKTVFRMLDIVLGTLVKAIVPA